MNPTEGVTNKATEKNLASLPMISGLWDAFYTTVFLVPHFVIFIVDKLTDYFCFYIPAMFIPLAIIFYQIIQKKLVPNYQNKSKNIFGRKNETVQ